MASIEARCHRLGTTTTRPFAVEIKNTTGATRERLPASAGTDASPRKRSRWHCATTCHDGDRRRRRQLTADVRGPPLRRRERRVPRWRQLLGKPTSFDTEIGRPSFVAWYRNPSRATPAALRIAYETDAGSWTSVQPDFIVVSQRDDGSLGASIVDPHGDHLADARNKLVALADFAENHGDHFVRIESISKTSTGLRSLDLKSDAVRDLVRSFEGAEVASLYESPLATPYSAAPNA